MKNLYILVFVCISLNLYSQDTFVFTQSQNYVGKSGYKMVLNSYSSSLIGSKKQIGIFQFTVVNTKRYAESIAGINFGNKYIETGVGMGIETSTSPLRSAVYLLKKQTEGSKINGYLWYESGFNNHSQWHIAFVQYPVLKNLQVGLHTQKFFTTGVRLQWKVKNFIVWSSTGVSLDSGDELSTTIAIRKIF